MGNVWKKLATWGSGCGAVGRAVASNTRDTRFQSSRRQFNLLSIVLNKLYRKDENKEKGPRMAQFKNWATSGHTGAFDPAKGGCLEID